MKSPLRWVEDFRALDWHFRTNRSRYIQAFLFGVISFLFQIYIPFSIGHFVDLIKQNQITFFTYLSNLGLLILSIALSYLSVSLSEYQFYSMEGPLYTKLKVRLLRGALHRPPAFFIRYRTGELTSLAMQDCREITTFATFGMSALNDSVLHLLVLFLGTCIFIDPLLTCLAVLPMIPMFILCQHYAKTWDNLASPLQSSFEAIYDDTLEVVNGLRVVRSYGMEASVLQRFSQGVQNNRQLALKQRLTLSLYDLTVDSLIALSFLITLVYSAPKIANQEMTIGTLMTFLLYLPLYVWPCMALGEFFNTLSLFRASWNRVRSAIQLADPSKGEHPLQKQRRHECFAQEPSENQDAVCSTQSIGQLEYQFQNFHYTYPESNQPSLKNIHCTLRPGMTLGVVGKTGSGKSTFLRQFFAFDPIPNQGLKLCGKDIMDYDPLLYRSKIGYVPQEAQVFSMSLRENLQFFTPNLEDPALERALRDSSFLEDLVALPDGLNTQIGERGINLSGGQKQRISIARALLQDPELLLLDDSLSAVDPETEANILQNLRRERKGKTTVLSAHRLSSVREADWILVLDNGCIAEEGTHDQLMERDGWYAKQYHLQSSSDSDSKGGTHEILG